MNNALALSMILSMSASALDGLSPLVSAGDYARYTEDCAGRIGLEASQSLALPVKTAAGLRYRQMYYRTLAKGREDDLDAQALAPSAVVQFDLAGRDVDCRVRVALPKTEPGKPLGYAVSRVVRKRPFQTNEARRELLYAATIRAGEAFTAGRGDEEARRAAAEFTALFAELSEPGLQKHYRALSPEFWAWTTRLEKAAPPRD